MRLIFIFALMCTAVFGKTNVVMLIYDDLGADACYLYGCETNRTPHLDSIATSGMRFTHMNLASSCNPSRLMMFSGRDRGIVETTGSNALSSNEVCIATIAKNAGYKTGFIGKADGFYVEESGDNYHGWLGIHGWEYIYTFADAIDDGYVYASTANDEDYADYQMGQRAVSFMQTNASVPFFLVLNMASPHGPNHDPPGYSGSTTILQKFWNQMEYIDNKVVSNILATIDSLGVVSNTLVIAMGDNGTFSGIINTFNGVEVVGGKATNDEKGYRVPFYVSLPGAISTNTTFDGYAHVTDIPVTLAEVFESYMYGGKIIHGKSFLDQLHGSTNEYRQTHTSVWDTAGHELTDNLDYKAVVNGGSFDLYSITNWPFGDDAITDPSQIDVVNRIRLEYAHTNFTIAVYGDRPWYGSTNENIFHIP